MKRNEKILAGALALVVVGRLGWPVLDGIFFEPIRDLEVQADVLKGQVKNKGDKNFELQLAAKRLTDMRRRGLPGDEYVAQRLYQQWLTDLRDASGLTAKVTPERRTPTRGVYTAVQVSLDGQATFRQLQTFLRRFHSADLLHRVVRLDVDSPAAEGDPQLTFVLSAEALNLDGAPKRNYLFPKHELKAPLAASAAELTLPAEEFAARPGDLLRIGTEFAAVTKIDGDRFEVARAADGTAAADHPAGTTVELFPVRRSDPKDGGAPLALAASIDSPFLKPRKYEPRFDGFADQKLARGGTTKMTVKVADYDAFAGPPKLALASAPDGLRFDAGTGELTWTPPADLPNGEYKVTLVADVPSPQKRLEQTATITLADPNAPPKLEPVSVSDVFLGETLRVPLKAADAETVTYKLDQGPPGAAVDPSTGEFTWTIPESFSPGDVTVTVSAADNAAPPLSSQQTFTVTVRENLKPFVKLVGAGSDPDPWAWLYDQSSNRKLTLRQGRSFKAAGLEGTVQTIGPDFVTYERNGEVWRIELGQSLQEVEKVGGEPVAEAGQGSAAKPVEAERPADGTEAPPASASAGVPAAS